MKLEKEVGILPMVTHYENSKDTFKGVTLMINIPELTKDEMKIIRKGQVSKLKLTLEVEEPILDDIERKYLSGVIRPFRNKIDFIKKVNDYDCEECISIFLNDYQIDLPPFKKGSMYKGMKSGKEYTLEDLGL